MEEIAELIKTGDNEKLREKLKKNPSLADGKTEQQISFLQFAAYCRNKEAIETLRKYKNNLDIFEAASIGDNDVVFQGLDEHAERINACSTDGFTLLGLASFFGHTSLVKLLLSKGADPNVAAKNQFKVKPLHSACAISSFEIAELLLKNGADVNAKQMQGVTPLHSAAHNGQAKLAKLLIDNGAGINAKMDNGHTPLLMAEEKDHTETAKLLKEQGGH